MRSAGTLFAASGGFDEVRYPHPSIEDIELGHRLVADGARIELDPSIQGTHLKRWTLVSMLTTDLCRRGIPWVALQARERRVSSALNLSWRHRLSALACAVGVVAVLLRLPVLAGAALGTLVGLNLAFYRLLVRRQGLVHGSAGVVLHGAHHLASLLAVPVGLAVAVSAGALALVPAPTLGRGGRRPGRRPLRRGRRPPSARSSRDRPAHRPGRLRSPGRAGLRARQWPPPPASTWWRWPTRTAPAGTWWPTWRATGGARPHPPPRRGRPPGRGGGGRPGGGQPRAESTGPTPRPPPRPASPPWSRSRRRPTAPGPAAIAALDPPPWVAFNRRFDPGAAAVRRAIPAEAPVTVELEIHYRRASWGAVSVADDALGDLGPHLVDWARWLLDAEVVEVRAASLAHERAALTLDLGRGRTARLRAATDAPHRERVEVRDPSGALIARHRRGGLVDGVLGRLRPGPHPLAASLAAQLDAFAAAVAGRPAPDLGTAADGAACMAVIDAARTRAAGRLRRPPPPLPQE